MFADLCAHVPMFPRPHAAAAFCRVLVMPNLVPPVTTTEAALAYRERILLRVPKPHKEGDFVPLMTSLCAKSSIESPVCLFSNSSFHALSQVKLSYATREGHHVVPADKALPHRQHDSGRNWKSKGEWPHLRSQVVSSWRYNQFGFWGHRLRAHHASAEEDGGAWAAAVGPRRVDRSSCGHLWARGRLLWKGHANESQLQGGNYFWHQ